MSDHERFDQVAYDKKANEQFTKKYLNKIVFLECFIFVFLLKNGRFAHSIFFNEQCEQINEVVYKK